MTPDREIQIRAVLKVWQYPKDKKQPGASDWQALGGAFEHDITGPLIRNTALWTMAVRGASWATYQNQPAFETDLNACVALVKETLPGWWWSVGSCFVSGDGDVGPIINPVRLKASATLAPDYNDPEAKGLPAIELHKAFNEGFITSLPPGGVRQACRAFLVSYCAARAVLCEIPPIGGVDNSGWAS